MVELLTCTPVPKIRQPQIFTKWPFALRGRTGDAKAEARQGNLQAGAIGGKSWRWAQPAYQMGAYYYYYYYSPVLDISNDTLSKSYNRVRLGAMQQVL